MLFRPLLGATLTAGLLASPLSAHRAAHELQDNRATLVLRGGALLEVTLHLNYADVLHRTLAPQLSTPEFLTMAASMPRAQFAAALARAHDRLRAGTHVVQANGHEVMLDNWTWPDAAAAQSALQRMAMQAVVAPDEIGHEPQVDIRADGLATSAATGDIAVRVQFPDEFQRVLMVWYKPKQAWSAPQGPSPIITF